MDKSGTADKRSQIPLRTRIHVHSRSPVAIVGASKKVDTQSERRAGAKLTRLSALDSFISYVWKISAAFRRDTRKDQLFADRQLVMGCHLLRTDQQDLPAKQLWQLFITSVLAEEGFRLLKTDLGLRPNFHQIKDCADGHIFITVLAHHVPTHILFTLRQRGDTRGWQTLRSVLQPHSYGTLIAPTVDDTVH